MNLKSHYKMIIAIIIVVILVSSLSIYFYPHNDTEYYNNGKSVDVRYFSGEEYRYHINNRYYVSSHSINKNKVSYLNSTMINLFYIDLSYGNYECLLFNMDIHISGLNSKYIYVTADGSNNSQYLKICENIHTYNATCYGPSDYGKSIMKIPTNQSLNNLGFQVTGINTDALNGKYNFTVKVSAGKLYNVFYIDTVRESAVYGFVNETGTTGADQGLNSEFFAYDLNSSMLYNINITNGYYYLFTVPGNKYEFYSYYNNTMNRIFINNSTEHNIYTMNAPEGSMFTNVYLNTLLGK
ncbi:MAG: hypothetical protein RE471_09255 [Ferroplasma sp.]|uniref:hypothetical protein n=1 Tax=Ferroplasma sp. TaxID=2591003 RepID=UPI00281614F7|nr:hypothetical protein [Ferroplasma sp.]WMT51151.1 MAG: hypothetical protein RE471_09255 [Ferroplasma sp.]